MGASFSQETLYTQEYSLSFFFGGYMKNIQRTKAKTLILYTVFIHFKDKMVWHYFANRVSRTTLQTEALIHSFFCCDFVEALSI